LTALLAKLAEIISQERLENSDQRWAMTYKGILQV
jgi:hypothetical protein